MMWLNRKKGAIVSEIGTIITIFLILCCIPAQSMPSSFIQTYDMVVIAPELFSEEISSFIAHKQSIGLDVFDISTESIYETYGGVDHAEQIKYFIKDALETYQITYVLLLGDIDLVPIRTAAVSWEHLDGIVVDELITDFYYEDIYDQSLEFSSWDTNHDGVFSEVKMITNQFEDNETFHYIDEVDLTPDVICGRIPCSTNKDASIVLQKIIDYESKPADPSWFNRLILMGGDTFPNIGNMNEGEFVTNHVAETMDMFMPIKLWTSTDTFTPWKINKEITKGAGFVSYSGHGFPNGFGTSKPNSDALIQYRSPYMLGMLNGKKYPVFFFDACLTADLDFKQYNIERPCFAWSLLKKPFGGAIACIGATRIAYGGFVGDPLGAGAPCLHSLFFDSYEPGICLGYMFHSAKSTYADTICVEGFEDCLTIQEFVLLGDPSLKIGGYDII